MNLKLPAVNMAEQFDIITLKLPGVNMAEQLAKYERTVGVYDPEGNEG